jgi:hypothetical protein
MNITRRTFIATAVATPVAATVLCRALSVTPITKPTTNILHLGARFGRVQGFTRSEMMKIFGVRAREILSPEESEIICAGDTAKPYRNGLSALDTFDPEYSGILDKLHALAEAGQEDIFRRGQLLVDIRKKVNWHCEFDSNAVHAFMNSAHPKLDGFTLREMILQDIELASEKLEEMLSSDVS